MAGEENSESSDRSEDAEQQEIHERSAPSGKVVYKAILKEADAELQRPSSALAWSGLAANLIGAFIVALAITKTDMFPSHVHDAFHELGHAAMSHSFANTLLKGVFAGWLIALIVWLLPFAETSRLFVILLLTYVVGIGNFSHIIAGAVEVFALAWAGEKSWAAVFLHFVVPTLIGNTIGGVTLVAALNHAQVVAGGEGEDV